MSDKKRSAKRKWKNALLAAALTASVILALPAWSVGRAEATTAGTQTGTTSKTYVEQNSTLTIKRAGTNPEKQGTITVDLYKVADAKQVPGYDAYKLEMADKEKNFYGSEIISALENAQKATNNEKNDMTDEEGNTLYSYNEAYRALAQQAARKIFASGVSGEAVDGDNIAGSTMKVEQSITIKTTETPSFTGLAPGMYLVIAHGENLKASQYIGEKNGQFVTMAYNNGYAYSYLPELISLPMRGTDGNAPQGIFTTAQNAGDWQYAVTAELKAEETVQMHSLTITKEFTGVPAGVTLPGNDGCIFRIDAVLNGQAVYSKVVTINYGGTHSITLTDVIPEGAEVTVEEVYDGASFDIAADDTNRKTTAQNGGITLGDDDIYRVSFENTYNGTGNGGSIVENRFTRNDNGYTHEAVHDGIINPQQ